jgi:hypothetical protein
MVNYKNSLLTHNPGFLHRKTVGLVKLNNAFKIIIRLFCFAVVFRKCSNRCNSSKDA